MEPHKFTDGFWRVVTTACVYLFVSGASAGSMAALWSTLAWYKIAATTTIVLAFFVLAVGALVEVIQIEVKTARRIGYVDAKTGERS